jgi:phospholipid/cholesterol/gamma-HCH transport system permease protein
MTATERSLFGKLEDALVGLGGWGLFSFSTLLWLFRRPPRRGTLLGCCYWVGVRSVPVVVVTGTFIGMLLAVQTFWQFNQLGLGSQVGALINISVVRELGPVLTATMLAGRVGSAMAAELGTMRVGEQIDALDCLGVNPVHYLVVPRFLACVLLIPLLTVMADAMGVLGGAFVCIQLYHVEAHAYWANTAGYISLWDLIGGFIRPLFFGAAIALISCERGFNSQGGAEGVGRASTEAFVMSFMAVLGLDFFLGMFDNALQEYLWPGAGPSLM